MTRRSKHRSRIAHFKSPFIIGVLGSGAALSGCNTGKIQDDSPASVGSTVESTTSETVDECPALLPQGGSSCTGFESGLECGLDECTGQNLLKCSDAGVWETLPIPTCNPPIPLLDECPAEPPLGETSCVGFETGLECRFDACSGAHSVECGDTGVWEYLPMTSCNPPPFGNGGAGGAGAGVED